MTREEAILHMTLRRAELKNSVSDLDEDIKAFDMAIEALSSSEKPNRWIPVSERLPKGSDIVLLSLPPHIDPDGEKCSASVICGHYIGGKDKEWGLSDGDTFGYGLVSVKKGTNPIAWMPLPNPYKADGGEEE